MNNRLCIDGRNFLEKANIMDCGFKYIGIGC
jgi:hypothetical protein